MGGALYNCQDFSFKTGQEKGTFDYPYTWPGGGRSFLRKQIRYLKDFLYVFDFIRMQPDYSLLSKTSTESSSYTLSAHGKQYAAYLYSAEKLPLELSLPPGVNEVE